MVTKIKLFKKVTFTIHAIISTSVLILIILPEMPICFQQFVNLSAKNLIEYGTSLMINLNDAGDMFVSMIKWGHRKTSLYPYDPCLDKVLKVKIRKEMNSLTNWELVIRRYGLEMCRRAIEVVAEQNNVKKVEKGGTEDNSFNLLNVHFSSAGLGIGALVILIFLYKIIKHSSVKSWKEIVGCIFPCSHCAKNDNATPTRALPNHNNEVNNEPIQYNQSVPRIRNVGSCSPGSTSRIPRRRYESAEGQKSILCGPNLAATRIHSSVPGKHGYSTESEKKLRIHQGQAQQQQWYDQQQQGHWGSRQQHLLYTQPDPSFWLREQQRCSGTLMPYSNTQHPQPEPHGCSLAVQQQQELQQYRTMFQQNMIQQTNQKLRLQNQNHGRSSPTTTEEENKKNHSEVVATTSKCAPSAPVEGEQPGYTEPHRQPVKPRGGPSYENAWQHLGLQEECQ